MLKVYIADDEEVVRQGLKKIINWEKLDFEICGEAGNGLTAYNEIKSLKPDLILIDIRMPKLQGLDLASQLRKDGYKGHIIVLSGYSEFKYAQEAIRCAADYYLTKPIEEEELFNAVSNIENIIKEQNMYSEHLSYYQEKAIDKILEDIIKGDINGLDAAKYTLDDLDLKTAQYQVLLLQPNEEDSDSFRILCENLKIAYTTKMIKRLKIDKHFVLLLKGELIIRRFRSYKENCNENDNNPFFVAEGHVVTSISQIHSSFCEALSVLRHHFFFEPSKHIAEKSDLFNEEHLTYFFTAQNSKELGQQLYDLIMFFKKAECETFLNNLKNQIIRCQNSAESIKSVLAGMYIFTIQEFKRTYVNYNPEFLTNAEIIQWIHECTFLQEILDFIKIEAFRLIQIIGGYSSESIVDEIVEFMKHHFSEDIKLKNLAPKFGYNSSYLGKIFSKKTGIGFNDYMHKIRTEKAKELLLNKKYKVYEISSLVGYKNVDYFHLKFKQFEDCTPNEYRIANHIDIE